MANQHESWSFQAGIFIFVIGCGFSALELTNFGFGIDLSFSTALLISVICGAIGGALICPSPLPAGLVGGLIAGPLGLIAIYYYTLPREEVYHLELVLVQAVASLPGVGVGKLIQFAMVK